MTPRNNETYQCTPKGIVDLGHCAGERVELSAGLTALLELTLQSAEDVVKGEAAFAWRTHAAAHSAHARYALLGGLLGGLGAAL
jgi:hypothetical protein